jgi:hypothetical protein
MYTTSFLAPDIVVDYIPANSTYDVQVKVDTDLTFVAILYIRKVVSKEIQDPCRLTTLASQLNVPIPPSDHAGFLNQTRFA